MTQNMRAGPTTHASQAHQATAFALSNLCRKKNRQAAQQALTAAGPSCCNAVGEFQTKLQQGDFSGAVMLA
jgi:hypothetical protein